ncbi:MAG: phosphoenolpyruvate carboxykinase (GTP) [Armatimonadetes bacterium]|nr:phosphoenolpyruvate carboxykinase (GTP) [Armatimonadota bacterium]
MNEHRELQEWVKEMARMCQPDRIVWITGSEEEKERLTQEAVESGEIIQLNQEKLPGCVYHRTAANDVARTEDLTYICTTLREDAGPTNNWMSPDEGYRRAREIFEGSMKGRTMYVIPFSMGPVGSPFSKIGVELTDSIYVVLNMRIMTHIGSAVLKQLGTAGVFTKCLHGKADLDINRRLILHFPEDNIIWSVGSGYGGNVLLGKKCLALRIASYLGKREGWFAEHMLIMGVEFPNGRVEYVAAAFPSACGKTNLAMLIPPEGLKLKGYRIWTVGDDIAWMRIDTDGRLWAINPETGFFGVAPGTNLETNPNMMKTISRNTIYTNVVLSPDGMVWWEGGDGDPPSVGLDWQGKPWRPDMVDENGNPVLGAHPNSRFTTPLSQCPSHSFRTEHHHGVPISAIVFGGRRAQLAPLVYEAFDWEHGVYVGATMASERTAAQFGKIGEVRRDPMAMIPFCGYHMGDYFDHWLEMGKRMTQPPKIFHVNWFRTDENGDFLWPGYGENLRVIEWILDRCRSEADARETPIGYIPTPDSLDLTGLDISQETLKKLFAVDPDAWREESNQVTSFFQKFGNRFPKELWEQHDDLRLRLRAPISMLRPGSEIRHLAAELNETIQRENPYVYAMLSDFGKRIYFPKGILSQSAEAKQKATRFDATIGIAREDGNPMFLPSVMKHLNGLSPAESLTYAPATGRPDLRKKWREELLAKNPSLAGKSFSTPIVTSGVTHALSLVGDLFVDKGDMILLPDKFWENYELLFGVRMQAQLALYPFFNAEGRFSAEGLRRSLATRTGSGKTIVVLNFPNNPTGYSITKDEADTVAFVLREAAENGCDLVVVTDDAYFGLFYGDDVLQESLFARIASLHERILAVKVDGPTKEHYVWGFRTGMLTFSTKAALSEDDLYTALEKKVAGAIRSAISNCSHPAQSVLLKAMSEESFASEQKEKRAVLQARAKKVWEILKSGEFSDLWEPYPFNSGYFMCLKLKKLDAEAYRKHLLDKYGVGVIADGKRDIRVAFSAVDVDNLPALYSVMATAARELLDGNGSLEVRG